VFGYVIRYALVGWCDRNTELSCRVSFRNLLSAQCVSLASLVIPTKLSNTTGGQRMACQITAGTGCNCCCCCRTFVRQRKARDLDKANKAPDFSYLPAVDSHSCLVLCPNRLFVCLFVCLFVVADKKRPSTYNTPCAVDSSVRAYRNVCFVYSYRKKVVLCFREKRI
jgi:hypothetical protein